MKSKYHCFNLLKVPKANIDPSAANPLQFAGRQSQEMLCREAKLSEEVAIIETDKNGFLTSWSGKAEQIYGYDFEEMVAMHIASLYTCADLFYGRLIKELQAVEDRGVYFTCGWQKRKSGQEFWTTAECVAIRDSNGGLLGYRKFVVEMSDLKTSGGGAEA